MSDELALNGRCLNLGCGTRYRETWVNIDFVSSAPGVIAHNLLEGIPFRGNEFDVVYHSHVLEHFNKCDGEKFIRECYRVLKPGGILRIAVPDLERTVREYLHCLDRARAGETDAGPDYDWIKLELLDQMVRTESGGEMLRHFRRRELKNLPYILERCGFEAERMRSAAQAQEAGGSSRRQSSSLLRSVKHAILKFVLRGNYEALRLGRFRQGGEVHQWMYDEISLAGLLKLAGFEKIARRSAGESYISNWKTLDLDMNSAGSVYKPDSLFMEAIKPPIDR